MRPFAFTVALIIGLLITPIMALVTLVTFPIHVYQSSKAKFLTRNVWLDEWKVKIREANKIENPMDRKAALLDLQDELDTKLK